MNFIKKILLASEIFLKLAASRLDTAISKFPHFEKEIMLMSNALPETNDKYLLWMVKELSKNNNIDEIIKYVQLFDKHYTKLKKKDLYQYSSLSELKDAFNAIVNSIDKTKNRRSIKESGSVKLYEDNDYLLYRIDSKSACDLYGKNTKWCITSRKGTENYDIFFYYTMYNSLFYFLLRKKPLDDDYDKVAFVYGFKKSDRDEYDEDDEGGDFYIPKYGEIPKLMEIRDAVDEEMTYNDLYKIFDNNFINKIKNIIENDVKKITPTIEQVEKIKNTVYTESVPESEIETLVRKYPGDKKDFISTLSNKYLLKLLKANHESIAELAFEELYKKRDVDLEELFKQIDLDDISSWKYKNKKYIIQYYIKNNKLKISEYNVYDVVKYFILNGQKDILENIDEKYYPILLSFDRDRDSDSDESNNDNVNTAIYLDKFIFLYLLKNNKNIAKYANKHNIYAICAMYEAYTSADTMNKFISSLDENLYSYVLLLPKISKYMLYFIINNNKNLNKYLNEYNISNVIETMNNLNINGETLFDIQKILESLNNPKIYAKLLRSKDENIITWTVDAMIKNNIDLSKYIDNKYIYTNIYKYYFGNNKRIINQYMKK